MEDYATSLIPLLLDILHDEDDEVVLQSLHVLSEIVESTSQRNDDVQDETQNKYWKFLLSLLLLFAENREFLEKRGTLIIR